MLGRLAALCGPCGWALLVAASCGPVPGGALAGEVLPPPPRWSMALEDGRGFCEIESRPRDPHSIQLECFVYEGGLYVQSHRWALAPWWPVTSWAQIWLEHPEVRVRLGGAIHELRAVHVTDPEQRAAVLGFRGYDPVPDGIALFRFEPRASDASQGASARCHASGATSRTRVAKYQRCSSRSRAS